MGTGIQRPHDTPRSRGALPLFGMAIGTLGSWYCNGTQLCKCGVFFVVVEEVSQASARVEGCACGGVIAVMCRDNWWWLVEEVVVDFYAFCYCSAYVTSICCVFFIY